MLRGIFIDFNLFWKRQKGLKIDDIIYLLKSWKKKSKLSPSKRIKETIKMKAETNAITSNT